MEKAIFIDLLNTPEIRLKVTRLICRHCRAAREDWRFYESGRGHIILERIHCSEGRSIEGLVAALNRISNVVAYKADSSMTVSGGDDARTAAA